MYHVKLAVKVLSVLPEGTAPPAMAPAQLRDFKLKMTCASQYRILSVLHHDWPKQLAGKSKSLEVAWFCQSITYGRCKCAFSPGRHPSNLCNSEVAIICFADR